MILKHLIALIILSVSFLPAFALDNRYYELADSADHAIAQGQWSQAENLILEALRLKPSASGNVMLMSNLAVIQMHRDEPEKAIETLTDALAIVPHSMRLLNNRARAFSSCGKDAEAIADYSTMLQIDSLSTAALFGRGMLSLVMTDLPTAERDFAILEQIDSDSRNTHIAMATLRMLRGQYEEAEKHYTALIEMTPTDEYYLGRAVCRINIGNYSDAGEDLAEGIRLNPENPDLYAQQSMLCKLTYRSTEAGLYMRMARKLGYED